MIGTWAAIPGSGPRHIRHAVGTQRGRFHPGDLNDALGRRCFRYATPAMTTTGRVRPAPFRDSTDPQRAFQPTASTTRSSNQGCTVRDRRSRYIACARCRGDAAGALSDRPDDAPPAAGSARSAGASLIGPTRPRKQRRRSGGLAGGEPALVGRGRRRLPRRARRVPGRGRLGLVPGEPAGIRGRTCSVTSAGRRILEVGCGSAPCARYLAGRGATVVAFDLSAGHARARRGRRRPHRHRGPAGAGRRLRDAVRGRQLSIWPSPRSGRSRSSPTRRGAMREVARVLRPGGRWVFAATHPMRWAFPDDPGPAGLTAIQSYFDRSPYVEVDDDGRAGLRRAPPHDGRPDPGDRRRPGSCCWT